MKFPSKYRSISGAPVRVMRRLSHAIALASVLCVAMVFPHFAAAQVANNTITGRVTDPDGAIVSGADITVTALATHLVLHAKTNSAGVYAFSQLQAGRYEVVAEAPGFAQTRTSVTLTVAKIAEVDFAMRIGKSTESITVQAGSATQLDTQDSNLSYVVGMQKVSELPLNGRNAYGLAALSPGIAPGNYFGQGLSTTRGAVVAAATNNFQASGGYGGSNEVLLDGIPIVVCCQGQPALTPSVEVVSQFKVITSDPPAQFGRSSGGFLNIVTKSGGNKLHGDIYEFFRNDALDAANYFTKRSGKFPFPGRNSYVLPHHFNQFGGFVGGPVFLPHIYNGKNKTFFTFGYEGTRNLAPTFLTATVPTALMRQGIFTEAPGLIYDPNHVAPDPVHTGQYIRQPIPAGCDGSTCYPAGKYIPSFNIVAQKMLPLIPAPNAPGVANNFNYVTNIIDTENQYNFRVDHNFSSSQRTFIRGSRDTDQHQNYGYFNKPGDPTGWAQTLTAYLFALGHVWTVSPSFLLQFHYGFANQKNYQAPNDLNNFHAADFGYSSQFVSQQQISGIPYLTFTGLAAAGSTLGASFNLWNHYTHSLGATATWQRGNQTFIFGYQGSLILENQGGLGNGAGSFGFTPLFTNGPNTNATVPSAQSAFDSWASFLLGYPSSGGLTRQETVAFNQFYDAVFLQDDWRFRPNLTLNLGVRWNIETGFKERHNRWADFDPSLKNPLSDYTGLPFTGGVQYLGVSGNPSRTWPTRYNTVAPRVGFSYSPTSTTVVRGGYGILYLPTSQRGFGDSNIGFTQVTPYVASIDGRIPVNTIVNPFPSGVLLPVGASGGVDAGAGSSAVAWVYQNPVSYQQQWNIGIEQHIARGVVFDLNYAGGHGVHLPLNLSPNDLNPKDFGAPGDQAQVANLQALVPNPFFGSSATGPLAAAKVQQVQLLAAFPQYAPNTAMHNNSVVYVKYGSGSASYNALQATVVVDHGGFNGSLAYTWSHLIGNVSDLTNGFLNPTGNPAIQNYYLMKEYGRSDLATDIPQRIVGNLIYQLPFGKGRRFAATSGGLTNALIGGWSLASIVSMQSGFPLGITQTGGAPFSGSRPTYVPGGNPVTSGSTEQRLGGYLNPAAFRLSQSFELGDVPRSAGVMRSPVGFQDDLSAIKNIGIFESIRLQFRLEAFNVMNKVQFGFPNTTFGSSSFGVISSQSNLPRNVQAALKLFF